MTPGEMAIRKLDVAVPSTSARVPFRRVEPASGGWRPRRTLTRPPGRLTPSEPTRGRWPQRRLRNAPKAVKPQARLAACLCRTRLPEYRRRWAGVSVRQQARFPRRVGARAAPTTSPRRGHPRNLEPGRGGHQPAAAQRDGARPSLLPGSEARRLRGEGECDCSGGLLRFKSRNDWPRNHLFFVGG